MKTGKPAQRLSEKLNADLEAIRVDHRDLINLQLENFKNDLNDAVNNALTTIDIATAQLDTSMQRAISRQEQSMLNMREKTWAKSLKGSALATALILLTLMVTALLEARTGLKRLGIETVEEPQATYLLLASPNTRLTSCRMGTEMVNCIRIGKE